MQEAGHKADERIWTTSACFPIVSMTLPAMPGPIVRSIVMDLVTSDPAQQ